MLKSLSSESDKREWKRRFSLKESRKRDTVSTYFYLTPIVLIFIKIRSIYNLKVYRFNLVLHPRKLYYISIQLLVVNYYK